MAQKTVMNFAELKAAVTDTETTEIKLGGNIVFSGGIRIPTEKEKLEIDGGGFTVTDNNSSSYADTIYVSAGAKNQTVTVKNVVWSGRNYYGVVCVTDDSANAGVTVVLSGVNYRGPQMIYNRYGTTVVKDCSVSIEKNGASASPQEFCEGNRLILEGKVDLKSAAASTAVVWFPFAGSAFTVAQNAVVSVDAPNTYFFYTDSAAKPVMEFQEGSKTEISVKNGMFYAAGTGAHIASSCLVAKRATLLVKATANNGVPLFKCAGKFSVEKDASVYFLLPEKGSSPVLYFSAAAELTINAPKNLLFYANGGKAFSFAAGTAAAPNALTFSAQQINLWLTAKTPFADAGGFDDPPTFACYRADGNDVTVTQKRTSSAVISTGSDLKEGDAGYPVSAENFDVAKVSVLAMGLLPLFVEKITDLSAEAAGSTDGGAAVRYTDAKQSADGTALADGTFSIALPEFPVVGEKVTVSGNRDFLRKSVSLIVSGSVSVTFLPDIPFNAFAVPKRTAPVRRLDPDWYLELTDTRPQGGKWTLYVSLQSPLQSADNVVENAVAFSDGAKTVILDETPAEVASGVSDGAGTFRVFWKEAEGVVLALGADAEYEKGKYASVLSWHVEFD